MTKFGKAWTCKHFKREFEKYSTTINCVSTILNSVHRNDLRRQQARSVGRLRSYSCQVLIANIVQYAVDRNEKVIREISSRVSEKSIHLQQSRTSGRVFQLIHVVISEAKK